MKTFCLKFLLASLLAVISVAMPTTASAARCVLTGTYVNGTDVSTCDFIAIRSLKVPAGVMLDLTKVKTGATITFEGTTTFAPKVRVLSAFSPAPNGD